MGTCATRPAKSATTDEATVMVSPCVSDCAWSPAAPGEHMKTQNREEEKNQKTLPLSPLDCALCVRGLVVHWGFMYARDLDGDLLRASLAAALVDFPVLAGRARITARSGLRQQLVVDLCSTGVAFTTANSASTLASLSGPERANAVRGPDNFTPPEFLTPMDPVRVNRGKEPLMAVKLTRLSGGGCVVGMTWSHLVADGNAMHAFVTTWTVGLPSLPIICFLSTVLYNGTTLSHGFRPRLTFGNDALVYI